MLKVKLRLEEVESGKKPLRIGWKTDYLKFYSLELNRIMPRNGEIKNLWDPVQFCRSPKFPSFILIQFTICSTKLNIFSIFLHFAMVSQHLLLTFMFLIPAVLGTRFHFSGNLICPLPVFNYRVEMHEEDTL